MRNVHCVFDFAKLRLSVAASFRGLGFRGLGFRLLAWGRLGFKDWLLYGL